MGEVVVEVVVVAPPRAPQARLPLPVHLVHPARLVRHWRRVLS